MAGMPGGPLSRQMSSSHITPRNLGQYQQFFRQNSIPESGWLEIRLGREESWIKYWVVFDNASSKLSYSTAMGGAPIATISMSEVVSFRTDTPTTLLITTTEHTMHLRAVNSEELKGWLFCFQKSVALVLSQLIDGASSAAADSAAAAAAAAAAGAARTGSLRRSYNSGSSSGSLYSSDSGGSTDDGRIAQVGLLRQDTKSYYPSEVSTRRRSANDGVVPRAFTDEDIEERMVAGVGTTDSVGVQWERSRSTLNLARLGPLDGPGAGSQTASIRSARSTTSSSASATLTSFSSASLSSSGQRIGADARSIGNATSTTAFAKSLPTAPGLSMSPAIPIFMGLNHLQPQGEVKLAGSYVESYAEGRLLEEHIRGLDLRTRSASDQASEASGTDQSDGEDDGLLLFDLEEAGQSQSQAKRSPSRNGRASRASRENSSSSARFSPSFLLGGGAGVGSLDSCFPSWDIGTCSKLGPRSSNEDRIVALPDLSQVTGISSSVTFPANSGQHGYFAVFDGHCGQQASTHLQETLHEKIAGHPSFLSALDTAITETCVAADKEFLAMCKEKRMYCGTTALGALVRGNQLTVFNIGDCRAVLCSSGTAVAMSTAHAPGRPDESDRITKAGGWITEEKELYMGRLHRMDLSDPVVRDKAQQVNWVTIHRVCGELAVSRSIGDPDYKGFTPGQVVDAAFLWPDGHSQIFHADLVIPVPEIVTSVLTPADEFMLLASDGLWDVLSESEVVARTRSVSHLAFTPPSFP